MNFIEDVISNGYFEELYRGEYRSYYDYTNNIDNFISDEQHITMLNNSVRAGLDMLYIITLIGLMTGDDVKSKIYTTWYIGCAKETPNIENVMARYVHTLLECYGILAIEVEVLTLFAELCDTPADNVITELCIRHSKLINKIRGELI